jgi:hypothetical protein
VQLQDALARFHQYRAIFEDVGIRPNGFALPRQHSLNHYFALIRAFGAPNGLCSSITESKHIVAIKEPWRRSSRHKALGQVLLTNQRLDKLAAARVYFTNLGMLEGTCLSDALKLIGEFFSFGKAYLLLIILFQKPCVLSSILKTLPTTLVLATTTTSLMVQQCSPMWSLRELLVCLSHCFIDSTLM